MRLGLVLTLGLILAPVTVEAQATEKVYRIGILGNVPLADSYRALLWGAFTQGLRELGYMDGSERFAQIRLFRRKV
jgi:hypothetical protein